METNFADSPTRNVFAPAATTLPLPATRNSTSPGGDPSRTSNRKLVERLGESKIYQDYEKAFSAATGLPVSLSPLDSWQLPNRGKKQENGFCALMGQRSRSCSQCQIGKSIFSRHRTSGIAFATRFLAIAEPGQEAGKRFLRLDGPAQPFLLPMSDRKKHFQPPPDFRYRFRHSILGNCRTGARSRKTVFAP